MPRTRWRPRIAFGVWLSVWATAACSASAQTTISYHIGNSRTHDYLAVGGGHPSDSAIEDLAALAGQTGHAIGYHINWGQPLQNILLNPTAHLTIGGIDYPQRWDEILGSRFEISQLVVQPFWQPDSFLGADGRTLFEPATLQSDVDAIGHWLSLIPESDGTRLYIAGVSPTLAYQTFDDDGARTDPTDDWLENSQWEASFEPTADDRVVTTAAYYDALYHSVAPITDRDVSVIPSGRVFKELYNRGFDVFDLYSDDLHINPAGELVESLTVAVVMFELDPFTVRFSDLPLDNYDHPLVDEEFYTLVQSAVRDVVNDYEYDFVTFVPEPSSAVLALLAGFGLRLGVTRHPALVSPRR